MARAEMQSSRAVGAFETISTWFSSDAEPKGAAKGLLERIIVEERDRSVLAVCRLRFLFGTLNALVVFPTAELEGHTALWPSRYGAVLYAVLAGLLLLLVQFKPKTRGFAAFAPAFLDVPLVGTIEYVRDANGAPLNLVHRDLNPPNILLSRVGEVKIADFGIARSADRPSLTQPGVMRGKLAYAAPEQAMDQPLDARTDLFALGITLYESATGQRLFGQQSETEMLRAVLENAAENPAAARPELPAVFCEAVHALLQREPSKRLQSGGALEEKLAAVFRAHASEGRQQLIKLISEVGKEAASVEPIPSLSTALTETVTRTALKQP